MQRIIGLVGVLAISTMLYSGCATSGTPSVSTQEFVQSKQDQPSSSGKLSAGNTIELSVEVDGNMEIFSHRAQINQQGMATLPLVGDVEISGCTLSEARGTIAKTYGAYYVNPPVIMLSLAVDPGDGEWGAVTVMGRVGRPGRVALRSQSGINLTEAIQEAGGFSGSAKKNDIRISRQGQDGKRIRISVDFDEIGQKGNAEADVKLMDGDIVYVPERIF